MEAIRTKAIEIAEASIKLHSNPAGIGYPPDKALETNRHVFSIIGPHLGKNRTYNAIFHVRWFNASPDTYERSILSINNRIPAPTIIVEQGDIINIPLINESPDEAAIHWHGLL
ncbi:unnamed protein product [Rotaria sordida]|uniref:Plastocyanin-like domain-containing protein n=1 Tax=Rotaria sordida TaxID=392033 RepID=A0A819Q371_9BILA|nr:unnamed protein product [Rotaria sordida]CAF4021982.1 unnamed protein product [Rotaria sordida]